MNALETLKKKAESNEAIEKSIMDEIVAYFYNWIYSDMFDNYVVSVANVDKRNVEIFIEFWQYHSGCSATNFRVGNCFWYNPENPHNYESCKYKGIELKNINFAVCNALYNTLIDIMEEKGFKYCGAESEETGYKYFSKGFIFSF